jgi:hypothetical protein
MWYDPYLSQLHACFLQRCWEHGCRLRYPAPEIECASPSGLAVARIRPRGDELQGTAHRHGCLREERRRVVRARGSRGRDRDARLGLMVEEELPGFTTGADNWGPSSGGGVYVALPLGRSAGGNAVKMLIWGWWWSDGGGISGGAAGAGSGGAWWGGGALEDVARRCDPVSMASCGVEENKPWRVRKR